MKKVLFYAVPFAKEEVTLALESGVDAVIVEPGRVDDVAALGRIKVMSTAEVEEITLKGKADEEVAVEALKKGNFAVLEPGWEIIPVENILAQAEGLGVKAASLDQARLAAGILEKGVESVVVLPEAAADIKAIVSEVKLSGGTVNLVPARVTEITPVGLGHRVCVDTLSMLRTGQGLLVGNSSAFTFLVNAETESNPYVAARPFRINAGAVHAYVAMPEDRTSYLEELSAGSQVMVVAADGSTSLAVVGRSKVEVRPMLLIRAATAGTDGGGEGAIFLQNAETIRLVRPGGEPVSVVSLKLGDEILVREDTAGRHFGMRISEDIKEG